MKTCRRCGSSLPVERFGKDKRHRDGLQSWCRDCSLRRVPFGPAEDTRRFPIDSLLVAMGAKPRLEAVDGLTYERAAAEVFGVGQKTIIAWRARGMRWPQADRAACAAGFHPAEIWSNWFEAC